MDANELREAAARAALAAWGGDFDEAGPVARERAYLAADAVLRVALRAAADVADADVGEGSHVEARTRIARAIRALAPAIRAHEVADVVACVRALAPPRTP